MKKDEDLEPFSWKERKGGPCSQELSAILLIATNSSGSSDLVDGESRDPGFS